MLDFRRWLGSAVCEGTNPGAKTGLYPLGYGGVGLYPPQWYPTRSADAIFYLSIDDRIYKGKDGGSFDITHMPGDVNSSMNRGDDGIWDISHLKGSPSHRVGSDLAAKNGDGGIWSIRRLKGNKDMSGPAYIPSGGEGGVWDIRHIRNKVKNEEAGGYAIVGCDDSPNYQVWGARSDLGCRKKDRTIKMKFKDWAIRRGKHGR